MVPLINQRFSVCLSKGLLPGYSGFTIRKTGFSTSDVIGQFGKPIDPRLNRLQVGESDQGNPFMQTASLTDEEADEYIDFTRYKEDLQDMVRKVEDAIKYELYNLPAPPTELDSTMYNIQLYLDYMDTSDGKYKFSEITKLDQRKPKWIMIMMDTPEYMEDLIRVLLDSKIEWDDEVDFVIDKPGTTLHVPAYPFCPQEVYDEYLKWSKQFENFTARQLFDICSKIKYKARHLPKKELSGTERYKIQSMADFEYMKVRQQVELNMRDKVKEVKKMFGVPAQHVHYVKTKQKYSLVKAELKGKIFGKPIHEPNYWEKLKP